MPDSRIGGDFPRDRKRPLDELAPTGDRKRFNHSYNQQERPRPKDSSLHLSTTSKGRSEYPVHPSPSSASPHSNISARNSSYTGEIKKPKPYENPHPSSRDPGRKDTRSEIEPNRDSNDSGRELGVLRTAGEGHGILGHPTALASLAEYSELIATRSALIHQRAVLQEKLGRMRSREDRWQKYYNSFAALAEDYDRESKTTISDLGLIENKIKQNGYAQEAVARTLMSTVLENITLSTPNFAEDIGTCRKDVRANHISLMELKDEVKRLQNPPIHSDLEQKLRILLEGYEKRMEDMTDRLSKMQLQAERHETLLVHVPAIQTRVHRFDDFESAAADTLMDNAKEIETLRKKIESLGAELSRSKSPANARAAEMQKEQVEKLTLNLEGKLQQLALNLGGRLDKTARATEVQREKVEALALDVEKGKTSEVTWQKEIGSLPSKLTSVEGELRGRLDSLEEDLRQKVRSMGECWAKSLSNFEEQQQLKDDELSKELNRIDDALVLLENATGLQRPADAGLGQNLQKSVLHRDKHSQTESLWQPDDSLRLKVEQLESSLRQFMNASTGRTDGMEVLLQSQQQRFDNLSTEALAKSMIHYMRLAYPPHPANVAEYMRTNFATLQEQRTSMMATINANAARCQAISESFPALCHKVDHLHTQQQGLERKITEVTNRAETGFELKIGELKKASSDHFDSLNRKWADLKQVSSTQFKDLQTFVTEAGSRLSQVEATTAKEIAAIQNTVNANESRLDNVEAKQLETLTNSQKKSASPSEPQIKTRDSDTYSCSSDSDPPIATQVRRSNRGSNRPLKDSSLRASLRTHSRNGRPRLRHGG